MEPVPDTERAGEGIGDGTKEEKDMTHTMAWILVVFGFALGFWTAFWILAMGYATPDVLEKLRQAMERRIAKRKKC